MCLPLDLSVSIDSDDPMWPLDVHNRSMLLKTFLFVFMEGHRSLSEVAHLCKSDTRYLYLSNQEKPSFMTIKGSAIIGVELQEHAIIIR